MYHDYDDCYYENYDYDDDDDDYGGKENENGKLENVEHSVFHFNLAAICSLSKYSELPKKDSHLKYDFGEIFFVEKTSRDMGRLCHDLNDLCELC